MTFAPTNSTITAMQYRELSKRNVARKRPRHMEDDLQIQVIAHLEKYYPSLLFFHVPNGGKRTAKEGARFKQMGVRPGVADVLIFWQNLMSGKKAAIELKSSKGTLQPSQIDFKRKWVECGGLHTLCRSLDEVISALNTWGVPRG